MVLRRTPGEGWGPFRATLPGVRESGVRRVGAGVLVALVLLGAAAAGCATTDAPADASDQPADAPADASDQPADAPADASLEPNATV
ncbi:MAG: hypothetical protein D6683_12335, partial [Actinomyces sp.]